ncbi:hypothetical protein BGZ57DRAFT_779238, partial [Hyaloscypha finlandica]
GAISHKEYYKHRRFINNNILPPRSLDRFKEFIDRFYLVYLLIPIIDPLLIIRNTLTFISIFSRYL